MNPALRYGLSCCLAALFSCSDPELYKQSIKSLDSLDGALGLIKRELLQADTSQLQKSVEQFATYKVIIDTGVRDTLSQEEAETLRSFFQNGEWLGMYLKNRPVLIERTTTIHANLQKLRHDLNEHLLSDQDLQRGLEHERKASAELTEQVLVRQKKYYRAMEEFKNALPATEAFIRKHNNNQLPQLVKEQQDY